MTLTINLIKALCDFSYLTFGYCEGKFFIMEDNCYLYDSYNINKVLSFMLKYIHSNFSDYEEK